MQSGRRNELFLLFLHEDGRAYPIIGAYDRQERYLELRDVSLGIETDNSRDQIVPLTKPILRTGDCLA